MMIVSLFRFDFYKFINTSTGRHRIDNNYRTYIAAATIDEAFMELRARTDCEVYSQEKICDIELISGNIVNKIIQDCGQRYIKNLQAKQEFEKIGLENNNFQIWRKKII